MPRVRHREVKEPVYSPMASNWQRQDLSQAVALESSCPGRKLWSCSLQGKGGKVGCWRPPVSALKCPHLGWVDKQPQPLLALACSGGQGSGVRQGLSVGL